MPLYDCLCQNCETVVEVLVNSEEDCFLQCSKCGENMIRKFPTGSTFHLKYNNKTDMCSWGNEGYQRSAYWDAVKEAKARGEKVKGMGEE